MSRRHVHVLIIGSGFAGLGAAIRLAQQGRRDYLVIERGSEVGGTWRDNTYPGAACDVPSHLYSFSFELNPNWSRSFSPQPEIQQYLRDTALKYGTLDHHLFDTEVTQVKAYLELWGIDPSNFRSSPDLAAGTVYATVKQGATVRTLPGSPIRVDVQNLTNGGIDEAFFGYWAIQRQHKQAVAKVTFDPTYVPEGE